MNSISQEGVYCFWESVRLLLHHAMGIERFNALGASTYKRTPERRLRQLIQAQIPQYPLRKNDYRRPLAACRTSHSPAKYDTKGHVSPVRKY